MPQPSVCNYYLQGRCRYGDKCRYLHPKDTQSSNRFAALQSPANEARSSPFGGSSAAPVPSYLNKETIIKDLTVEKPQWILSAYAPGRDAPVQLLEGPQEQSFEEMRLHHYVAVAANDPQAAIQQAQSLYDHATQQIQNVLSNIDGAINFLQEGANKHPNRIDICNQSTNGAQTFSNPSSNPFGQPSGQSSGSGFGQPSQPQPTSAFGQPSALGGGSSFGQPSSLGQQSSAFGKPSQLGAQSNPFGQPASGSGSSSQPNTGIFGQSTSQSIGAFGQPSQPSGNTFGRPTQPTASGSTFGKPAFGQPSQPTSSSFGTKGPSTSQQPSFGQPSVPSNSFSAPQSVSSNPFGNTVPHSQQGQQRNPFGITGPPSQSQSSNPFGAPSGFGSQTTQEQNANGFGTNANLPNKGTSPYPHGSGSSHPSPQDYSARNPSNMLTSWKGKPVTYVDGEPCYRRDGGTLEKIWFPDGPPPYNKDTELPIELYDEKTKEAYAIMRETGIFRDGWIPELPPRREWCRWDF